MWVAIGYPAKGKGLVLFEYHPSRAGIIPEKFLEGFKGYLQTDGYSVYKKAAAINKLIHVGCFVHARREFFDAAKNTKETSRANKALEYINKLYEIEASLRLLNLSDDIFVERRKKQCQPILDEFHAWFLKTKDAVPPKMPLGESITYALNEWNKLVRYLDRAYMTPDNNEIERTIRPFVIGRKNWIFSNTPRGARASTAMYSLVESAKANKLEPYAYLRFLFDRLPLAGHNEDALKKLLPCFVSAEMLKLD